MSLFLKDFGRGDHGNEQYQKFFFGCCSLLAYRDTTTVEEYFRRIGYDSINLVDIDGAQCYIIYNEKKILICIRRTAPKELKEV